MCVLFKAIEIIDKLIFAWGNLLAVFFVAKEFFMSLIQFLRPATSPDGDNDGYLSATFAFDSDGVSARLILLVLVIGLLLKLMLLLLVIVILLLLIVFRMVVTLTFLIHCLVVWLLRF